MSPHRSAIVISNCSFQEYKKYDAPYIEKGEASNNKYVAEAR